MWPQTTHIRRCTHAVPSRRQSPHSPGVSGSTGLRVSRERPQSPIVALSPIEAAARRLCVVWGVHSVVAEDAHDQDDMVERACRLAFKEGFAKAGERIIVVAGVPLGTPGATNFMRIAFVGGGTASEV